MNTPPPPPLWLIFFPDEEVLLIRKEPCRVNFGIRGAAGPRRWKARGLSLSRHPFPLRSPAAESHTASPPRKVGQPRLTFPISENALNPCEATNHTRLPFQLCRTPGGRLAAPPADSSLFRSPHLDAGGRRPPHLPGRDVTAPGPSRGAGGGGGSREAAGAGQGERGLLARVASARRCAGTFPAAVRVSASVFGVAF